MARVEPSEVQTVNIRRKKTKSGLEAKIIRGNGMGLAKFE